jgi:hypothetical protein
MKELIEECLSRLGESIDRFPWENRRAYGDWLAQTFYYVRHSTRLLAAAAARFPNDERGDALHRRFAAHMAEEKKHERLCVHDLAAIGFALDSFPERSATRMFYEPQYFKIEHQAPTALFGYILPLEALGPAHGARLIARVTSAHGETCTAFLRLHAAEDVAHVEKAFALVHSLPDQDVLRIEANVEQTTAAYVGMLDACRHGLEGAPSIHGIRRGAT